MVVSSSTSSFLQTRELMERETRATANRLAVACQASVRSIESSPHWKSSTELRHWWAALSQARTALNQSPPTTTTRAEREVAQLLAELDEVDEVQVVNPAESPPAGSGGGECGGAVAPLAPEPYGTSADPSWGELLGVQ
jgi:transposase-like protein